ncbi:Peroxidase 2 [Capsicum baccatum]|uniref:peroxidase n=1 Tax=Capsicum baccatum TaxID=33114 RepID=A0A2G2VSL4_CAPBA|nr:Peroxidase 2 [Capsicum baccatum]
MNTSRFCESLENRPLLTFSLKRLPLRLLIGLDEEDLVALSGGHTLGFAQCFTFRNRIYNETKNIDSTFVSQRQANCPSSGGDSNLASLDPTPSLFYSKYYSNLMSTKGLLQSDQALFSGGQMDELVKTYSTNLGTFSKDFGKSMIKMGNIKPLIGNQGQIRVNCRKVN